MSYPISRMDVAVVAELNRRGVRSFKFNESVCVYSTIPDLFFPPWVTKKGKPMVVYFDGPVHERKHREQMDEFLRDGLRSRGWIVKEYPYERFSKKLVKEFADDILEGLV